MTDSDERDTLPPDPDPMMAVVERIEKKLDRLARIAAACFDKVVEHEDQISDLRDEVEALKRIPSTHPHGNGVS